MLVGWQGAIPTSVLYGLDMCSKPSSVLQPRVGLCLQSRKLIATRLSAYQPSSSSRKTRLVCTFCLATWGHIKRHFLVNILAAFST